MQIATTNNLDDQGIVGDALIAFYEERAKRGVGIIVTEGLGAHASAHGRNETSLGRSRVAAYSPTLYDGLFRLADAVHRHESLIIGQIFHGGRQHHADRIPLLWAPSPLSCPHSGGVPHAMTLEEVRSAVRGFADAARTLRDTGFDGAEIHGAQGHLIQEFLSSYSNVRDDEYGGSFDNRLRFAREILTSVRAAVGDDFAIGLRLAGEEFSPQGIDLDEACKISIALTVDGLVDYLSVSMGNFNSIEIHTPDRHYKQAPFMNYPKAIREAVCAAVPVVGCGRVLTPDRAEVAIRNGEADIVGLCRPLLADEAWAEKAMNGEEARIRVCISCNQCWGAIIDERPVLCIQNPITGNELELAQPIPRAPRAKRVVVVGGGPAGMEAARMAASRGHTVILFERQHRLGGSVAIAATIPGHGETENVIGFLSAELERLGVDVRLGQLTRADWVLDEMPDTVVIATGCVPRRDNLPIDESFPVYTAIDVVHDQVETGERAIIFDEDGYYQAVEVAEFMARRGTKCWIVTRFWEVGREIPAVSRVTTLRALDSLGVEMIPTAWAHHSDGRNVTLGHYYSGRQWSIGDIDCLVHIGGERAEDALYRELLGRVPELLLIGDAYQPRRIHDAITEGHRTGRAI